MSAGLALKTRDGEVVRNAADEPRSRPTPTAGLCASSVSASTAWRKAAYDLSLDVRDEVSGARLQHHEPFTLARDSAAR